jgi:hypothetical protein
MKHHAISYRVRLCSCIALEESYSGGTAGRQPICDRPLRTCARYICSFEDQQALLYTLTMSDPRLAGENAGLVVCAER